MAKLRLCPFYFGFSSEFQDFSLYEVAYKNVYKPLGALLYSEPRLKFSFYFTGPQIEFFKKKNPEFLELLKNLVVKKQVEIIGGGFYNPLFPLLSAQDRADQIEKLSLTIRQNFGKRPRGFLPFADSWDPSLIFTLGSCSMEYVLLDSSLVPPAKQLFLPIVMSDRGSATTILPVYEEFAPKKGEGAVSCFERIQKAFFSVQKSNDFENDVFDRTLVIPLKSDTVSVFFEKDWILQMRSILEKNENIFFSLPCDGIKSTSYVQAYIHAGINQNIARWCFKPYERTELIDAYPTSIYDYLQTYGASRSLYDRMIHVSLLVGQFRGDKMRKSAAREKLMAAQSGEAFICRSSSELATFAQRQNSYKNLSEAEKLLRECSLFKESVTSYDYNRDGFKEYVCRLDKYNVCIGGYGGSIFELDIMKSSGNYVDNFSRIKKFDGIDDNYFRGIFVDHLFEDEEANKYCLGLPCKNGLFSAKRYKEVSFSSKKQEIHLETEAQFSTMDQPIALEKKYTVKSGGILVQYILRNKGPVAVKAKFAVEFNLAEQNLLAHNYKPYNVELVSEGEILCATSDIPSAEKKSDGLFKKVSAMQITDCGANVSFVFTPNEEAGATYFPVVFKRRNIEGDIVQNESRTFTSAFIWNVDLAAGMEVEKSISLAVSCYSLRKRNSAKGNDSQKKSL